MTWNEFLWFAIPAIACWLGAGILVYKRKMLIAVDALAITGICFLVAFIIGLWIGQERPPLRTMGETRLWYSFFLASVGYIVYKHWKYQWLLTYSCILSIIFICINIFRPKIHSINLMPALQSYWFIPHVTVYILSYAMLAAATICSFNLLYKLNTGKNETKLLLLTDNLVYIGFGFLLLGMLIGCLWAKEAWGNYWSWDPKETWAFITVVCYLLYIHMRIQKNSLKITLWILPFAFLLLLITWIGINYLPSAQNSIHVY